MNLENFTPERRAEILRRSATILSTQYETNQIELARILGINWRLVRGILAELKKSGYNVQKHDGAYYIDGMIKADTHIRKSYSRALIPNVITNGLGGSDAMK